MFIRTITPANLLILSDARLFGSIILHRGREAHEFSNIRENWRGCKWDAHIRMEGGEESFCTDFGHVRSFLSFLAAEIEAGAVIEIVCPEP
jgi:hypothetical protein